MVPRAVAQFKLALRRTCILGGEYFLTLPAVEFSSPCAQYRATLLCTQGRLNRRDEILTQPSARRPLLGDGHNWP